MYILLIINIIDFGWEIKNRSCLKFLINLY